ncbi:MAG: hypothetical protein QM492_12365, partial [Rhodobacterales bacterium]
HIGYLQVLLSFHSERSMGLHYNRRVAPDLGWAQGAFPWGNAFGDCFTIACRINRIRHGPFATG